jgi:hypothetical protein
MKKISKATQFLTKRGQTIQFNLGRCRVKRLSGPQKQKKHIRKFKYSPLLQWLKIYFWTITRPTGLLNLLFPSFKSHNSLTWPVKMIFLVPFFATWAINKLLKFKGNGGYINILILRKHPFPWRYCIFLLFALKSIHLVMQILETNESCDPNFILCKKIERILFNMCAKKKSEFLSMF